LKDSDGRLVKSHLDESALKAIAAATGGAYAPLGAENQGLDTIYQEALAPLAKHDLESRSQKVYTQRFQWPLGAALVALLGSLMISTRRRLKSTSASPAEPERPFSRFAVPSSLAALLGVCGLLPLHSANASPSTAATAYQHGDFASAQRDYAVAAAHDPKQPLLAFDAGAAAYKAGQFPQAAEAFQASVNASTSGDAHRLADQEDGYYNLGNTLYREGQKTEQADPKATIDTWTRSVKTYDAALQLRPDDADSKFNRDFVSRKLDALKKAQSQKNQSAQNQPKQSRSSSPNPSRVKASSPRTTQAPRNPSSRPDSRSSSPGASLRQARDNLGSQMGKRSRPTASHSRRNKIPAVRRRARTKRIRASPGRQDRKTRRQPRLADQSRGPIEARAARTRNPNKWPRPETISGLLAG
jgi:Ca-activated chloride channel family protein